MDAMNEDFTPEDAARLKRRYDAQQAGIDLDRDMCAHDYVNGHGCDACERSSRYIEWLMVGIIVAGIFSIAGWAGWTSGWFESVWNVLRS
jgi:hypothetical protein